MLNLLQVAKNVRNFYRKLSNGDNAQEYFDAQKIAIQAIKHEGWYKEIVQYREREQVNAMDMLSNEETPIDKVPYYRAKHNHAVAFLNRLDAMSS